MEKRRSKASSWGVLRSTFPLLFAGLFWLDFFSFAFMALCGVGSSIVCVCADSFILPISSSPLLLVAPSQNALGLADLHRRRAGPRGGRLHPTLADLLLMLFRVVDLHPPLHLVALRGPGQAQLGEEKTPVVLAAVHLEGVVTLLAVPQDPCVVAVLLHVCGLDWIGWVDESVGAREVEKGKLC